MSVAHRVASFILSIIFSYISQASSSEISCNDFLIRYQLQKSIKSGIVDANQVRSERKLLELKFNKRYRLAKFLGDKAMIETMEAVHKELSIDPKLSFETIWSEDFDLDAWNDILQAIPSNEVQLFILNLEKVAEKHLVFYKNYTSLVNRLIETNKLNYDTIQKEFSLKSNEQIFFSFSPAKKQVFYSLNYADKELSRIEDMLKRSHLSPQMQQEWSTLLLFKYQNEEVMEIIDSALKQLPNQIGYIELFNNFFDYLSTLKHSDAIRVAANVNTLIDGGFIREPLVQRYIPSFILEKVGIEDSTLTFFRREKKILKYEKKVEDYYLKKYNKIFDNNIGKNDYERMKNEVRAETSFYRGILNQCSRNKNGLERKSIKTPFYKRNSKRFTNFKITSGLAITTLMYSYFHWDEEEKSDVTSKWYGKLGYDLAWAVYHGFLGAYIITAQSTSFLAKYALKFVTGSAHDVPYSVGYEYAFGVKNQDAIQRLDELKQNPLYKSEVEKLVEQLENKRIGHKIMESIQSVFTEQKLMDGRSLLEAIQTEADLEKPEVQEALLELLSRQIYEEAKENTSSYFKTGYRAFDMWWFHRHWGAIDDLKSVLVGLYVFDTICKNSQNPGKAYFYAALAVTTEKLISRAVYYGSREYFIQE